MATKTFEDLEFIERKNFGKQAIIRFENGYGVSVLLGRMFYSNGINTYEVAVIDDSGLRYPEEICEDGDVLGWRTAEQVTEIMKKVQELAKL